MSLGGALIPLELKKNNLFTLHSLTDKIFVNCCGILGAVECIEGIPDVALTPP